MSNMRKEKDLKYKNGHLRKKRFKFSGDILFFVLVAIFVGSIVRAYLNGSLLDGSNNASRNNMIENSIMSYKESFPVGFVTDRGKAIIEEFKSLYENHPEYFWLTGGSHISFVNGQGIMTVDTRCDMDSVPEMVEKLNVQVNSIVKYANENFDTDYEKAKYVHDYLVTHCIYDEETYMQHQKDKDGKSMAYTAYGCIVDGKAVCDGYTKAYMLIMNELNIECGYVRGTGINELGEGPHSWNYIKLDDGYYMVDVTWDDPLGNGPNDCRNDYFCISTKAILENHAIENIDDVPECEGTKYLSK